MQEPVRLVVWDLDDTFWSGTLTEGGIRYVPAHHDIVIELSRRGIVNSICSKNDLAPVREVLEAHGIWNYFIFPSIDWSAKAARVAAIIDAVQLRPATVLFVDDNPSNRAHVAAAIPGIQVIGETEIAALLDNPLLAGKPDPGFSRLRHYKLLEQRHAAKVGANDDPAAFLRDSDIRATIIYDVENHLDRAIELINRTNQLNFTKRRLPDDRERAVKELMNQIAPFYARAGLVAVSDRFGDYGIVGFFLVQGLTAHENVELHHFCFSCRTLGMGVEQWLYEVLGRPKLKVIGEVVSDLDQVVDWIRPACELEVLEHLFKAEAAVVRTEVITPHGGLYLPAHHSALLARALDCEPIDPALLARLGMDASFYRAETFSPCRDGTLIVYSPTGDALVDVHKHHASEFDVPVWMREWLFPNSPYRTPESEELYNGITDVLSSEFARLALDDLEAHEQRYRTIVERTPANALLVVILPNTIIDGADESVRHPVQTGLNRVFRAAGRNCPNVRFIEMTELVASSNGIADFYLHFNRAAYWKLFQAITRIYTEWQHERQAA